MIHVIKGVGINIDTRRLAGSIINLETEFRKFKQLGFDYAEVPPAGLDLIFNGKFFKERFLRYKHLFESSGMKFTVHGPDPVDLSKNREEDFLILSATIDFASSIGADSVVYHCGWSGKDDDKKHREIENLKRLSSKLEEKKVCLVVENTTQTVEQTLEIVYHVNHPKIKLLIDVGHLFLRVRGDEEELIKQFTLGLPYTFEIHVHDNFGKVESDFERNIADQMHFAYLYGVGDLHLPIGLGQIPFEQILKLLQNEFQGIVVLEINDLNRFEKDIPESLSRLRMLMRK
ncbi:sugar phosphate isomerase/epimerase family protein [Pseudothermotoga sp.]|nr:sugar phosphate isomerase/epimerase [Pseudothermotoga sp.]MDW8139954.1 sugar phosphate isomerase/epimerase family protein [Pseudothermotoga sp.]